MEEYIGTGVVCITLQIDRTPARKYLSRKQNNSVSAQGVAFGVNKWSGHGDG